jgi:alkylation response protein AidB-like acyl-CoA dehydrogenase
VTGLDAKLAAYVESAPARLQARAQDAERLRRLPDETVREAIDAGFLSMLVPKKFGGGGAAFGDFFAVTRQLAHGCSSSAWTLSFLALHSWILSKFEPVLQEELFANGRNYSLVPAPLAPTGKCEKVDGGFRVSGRWEWSTGVMHAEWVLVNCIEEGAFGPRFCLLPISDVTVDDVWFTAGMAATGSNAVRADDVFVPEHRTLEALRLRMTRAPGVELHDGTNVGYPMSAVLALTACTPALGAAEGALAAFQDLARKKVQAYSGAKQADLPATHIRLGEGIATVKAARLVWQDAIRELEEIGPLGHEAPVANLASIRLASADVVRLANVAVNALCMAAGASAGFLHSPLQRALRDVQMMRGHVVYDWDRAAQIGGRVLGLGLDPTMTDLL